MGLTNAAKCDLASPFLALNPIPANLKGDLTFAGTLAERDSTYKENSIMSVSDEAAALVCLICNMVECNGTANTEPAAMAL